MTINFDAAELVQSQSPNAPFMVIFESDKDLAVVYALIPHESEPTIADQYVFDQDVAASQVVVRWNDAGDRAAIIVDERIHLVFDFEKTTTFSDHPVPIIETTWARQTISFSTDIAIEFGIDQFFKQPQLDAAIDTLNSDGSQTNRLLFYKVLLKSVVFVPITTKSAEDPNALIYTFPAPSDDKAVSEGNLICGFTNSEEFNSQMGQYGLSFQKISADFLCYQAKAFSDILGIALTSSNGKSVLVSRDEFQLLALISQPQRLNTQELLRELGNVFFDDVNDSNRIDVQRHYQDVFKDHRLVRAGYYSKPKVTGAKPMFSLVLTSTSASDDLNDLVSKMNQVPFSQYCECHMFSLSDIVAQAFEQSKQPL